jgi:hypothetical protein
MLSSSYWNWIIELYKFETIKIVFPGFSYSTYPPPPTPPHQHSSLRLIPDDTMIVTRLHIIDGVV